MPHPQLRSLWAYVSVHSEVIVHMAPPEDGVTATGSASDSLTCAIRLHSLSLVVVHERTNFSTGKSPNNIYEHSQEHWLSRTAIDTRMQTIP
jgi:hypothetical protein